MAVGLYVTSQNELTNYLAVSCQFARAYACDLIVFVPGREDGLLARSVRTKIKSRDDGDDNKNPRVRLKSLGEDNPEAALLEESRPLEKLLFPYASERKAELAQLADQVACTTVRLFADESNGAWNRISVPRDGYRHGSARRAAQRMSESLDGCELRLHQYEARYTADDLVLVGTPADGSREAEDIEEATLIRNSAKSAPAVGLVLTGHSRSRRVYAAFENSVQGWVPQMERDTRIKLTNDLHVFVTKEDKEKNQSNKKLKDERFDFVAMIGASSALASLGLVQDSAAVIIGAMLVAPLMSPILAGSLAVVHSHPVLFKRSWQMIAIGFLFAFAVSFVVGLLYPLVADVGVTREMASRCRPTLMDFLIGFAGGGAAAYARTRGQLSSALAGAAIAAALVPPIATGGLSCAFSLTIGVGDEPAHPIIGPLLLFGMNVLSIMVAASIALWATGIRSYRQKAGEKMWQRKIVTVLVLLATVSVCIAYAIDVGEPNDALAGEPVSASGETGVETGQDDK